MGVYRTTARQRELIDVSERTIFPQAPATDPGILDAHYAARSGTAFNRPCVSLPQSSTGIHWIHGAKSPTTVSASRILRLHLRTDLSPARGPIMTLKNHRVRLMTSCAVLCTATSLFAQSGPGGNQGAGRTNGGKTPDASLCPVIGGGADPPRRETRQPDSCPIKTGGQIS